jgi:hypothetical protein
VQFAYQKVVRGTRVDFDWNSLDIVVDSTLNVLSQCAEHMRDQRERNIISQSALKHLTIFGVALSIIIIMCYRRREKHDDVSGTIWLMDFSHSGAPRSGGGEIIQQNLITFDASSSKIHYL